MDYVVKAYASNAKMAGLDGIVCSAFEAPIAKSLGLISVTPGIRFDNNTNDQKRVVTPKMASQLGSDFIVVGRPITQALDPVGAYQQCLTEFKGSNEPDNL